MILKCYGLRSLYGPKSLLVDGSNDNSNWVSLDNRNTSNDYDNTGNNILKHYDITNNKEFRYIRITQGDTGGYNNHYFYIHNIYFYGIVNKN